jgi:hypothetical protein
MGIGSDRRPWHFPGGHVGLPGSVVAGGDRYREEADAVASLGAFDR